MLLATAISVKIMICGNGTQSKSASILSVGAAAERDVITERKEQRDQRRNILTEARRVCF